jgi:hypothetical protein
MDFKQRLLTFKGALTIAYTKPFVKLPASLKKTVGKWMSDPREES